MTVIVKGQTEVLSYDESALLDLVQRFNSCDGIRRHVYEPSTWLPITVFGFDVHASFCSPPLSTASGAGNYLPDTFLMRVEAPPDTLRELKDRGLDSRTLDGHMHGSEQTVVFYELTLR